MVELVVPRISSTSGFFPRTDRPAFVLFSLPLSPLLIVVFVHNSLKKKWSSLIEPASISDEFPPILLLSIDAGRQMVGGLLSNSVPNWIVFPSFRFPLEGVFEVEMGPCFKLSHVCD